MMAYARHVMRTSGRLFVGIFYHMERTGDFYDFA